MITLKEVRDLGAELWDWLAKNPDKGKEDWPRWAEKGGDVEVVTGRCFCCEFDFRSNGKFACEKCPIKWAGEQCDSDYAEFYCWEFARTDEDKANHARIIADLHRNIKVD